MLGIRRMMMLLVVVLVVMEASLAPVVTASSPSGEQCASCPDQTSLERECAAQGGSWCPCGPYTPRGECGACFNLNGSGGSCTSGLVCSDQEKPCTGLKGSACYSNYTPCDCSSEGELRCDIYDEIGLSEEKPKDSDVGIWRSYLDP